VEQFIHELAASLFPLFQNLFRGGAVRFGELLNCPRQPAFDLIEWGVFLVAVELTEGYRGAGGGFVAGKVHVDVGLAAICRVWNSSGGCRS
jgi:hypothetical protein